MLMPIPPIFQPIDFHVHVYRGDAELFVAGSSETIMSCEGTTQGGTESMGFYSGGLVPISHYQIKERTADQSADETDIAKKLFYADDGAGGGTLDQVLCWWNEIQKLGPSFGYFLKSMLCLRSRGKL